MTQGAGAGLIDASGADDTTAPTALLTGVARTQYVGANYVDKGYMTNYAAGYHLVRQNPKTVYNSTGQNIQTGGGLTVTSDGTAYTRSAAGKFKELGGTSGPIQLSTIDKSRIPASHIGILGDAGPGDIDEAILAAPVQNLKIELPAGMLLTEAFNDGPASFNTSTIGIELIDEGLDIDDQVACERGEATSMNCGPAADEAYFLQDTRDWFGVHVGSANVLMADGSVKLFNDSNGDGYFNPGFPVPNNLTDLQYVTIGYIDSTIELPPVEMFNGVFINEAYFKGAFEEAAGP